MKSVCPKSGATIVHIVTRLDRGGAAEVILDLVKALSKNWMRVALIVGRTDNPRTDLSVFCEKWGIELFRVPHLVRAVSPLNDLIAFIKVRRIIRRIKPDIVHTHTSKAGIIGRFASWSAGVKHIVHSPRGHIFYGYYNTLVTSFFVLVERFAAGITEKITTLTVKGLKDHIHKGIGDESKFAVIHSGVDVEMFKHGDGGKIRSETGFSDNLIAGWAGRLDAVKNCSLFIEAAALIKNRIPDARFIVAGEGEESRELEKLSNERGFSESLLFIGDRDDMPDVMAAFDVFVLSSHNEGFGRVLVEAMASGAVPVSTRVGGTVDVIEDGVSGILVTPGDTRALADAVCSLFEDDEMRMRLSENCKKRAGCFTVESMVKKFEELYAEILGL